MHHPSRRQPGQHPYARNSREQNPFFEKVEAPRHDPKTALRTANLNHLMQAAGIDKIRLAEALEMDIARVGDYLEGTREFNEGIAKHVEEQLGLEPRFMDTRHTPPLEVAEKTLKILRGEVEKLDDEDFHVPAVAAPAVVAPVVEAAPVVAIAPVAASPEVAQPENAMSEEQIQDSTQTELVTSEVNAPSSAEEPAVKPIAAAVGLETSATRIHIVTPTQPRVEPADTVVPTIATARPKVQKHSEVVIHTMAKPTPTQENEVTEMTISEEAMLERRCANFNILAAGQGAKARIARVMDVSPGHVTLLVQRKRDISAHLARDIETYFGLDEGWLDEKPTKNRELPQIALVAISNAEAVARPAHPEEDRPRRGRPRGSKNAATIEREATEAEKAPKAPKAAKAPKATAEVAVKVPGKRGRKPGVKNAPAQPVVEQAELALAEEAAPHAPAHQAAIHVVAAPVAEKRTKAHTTHAAAAPAAPARTAVAHAPAAASAPKAPVGVSDHGSLNALLHDTSNLAPVTVALLQLILEKSAEGTFGNDQALAMLPEVLKL